VWWRHFKPVHLSWLGPNHFQEKTSASVRTARVTGRGEYTDLLFQACPMRLCALQPHCTVMLHACSSRSSKLVVRESFYLYFIIYIPFFGSSLIVGQEFFFYGTRTPITFTSNGYKYYTFWFLYKYNHYVLNRVYLFCIVS
jgi:hypothetical protein